MANKIFWVRLGFLVVCGLVVLLLLSPGGAPATAGPVADAAASDLIPYQGRLTDSAGAPVADGAYDFQFVLYAAPQGGTALWRETQRGVAVRDGYFAALLGSELPFDGAVAAGDHYLEVAVRGPADAGPVTLSPRQRLLLPELTYTPVCPDALAGHCGETWLCTDLGLRVESDTWTGLMGISHANSGDPGVLGVGDGASEGVGVKGQGTLYGVAGSTTSLDQPVVVGVDGSTNGSGDRAYGVRGQATGSGVNRGVYGKATSDADGVIGVMGVVDGDGASTCGVYGIAIGGGSETTGVMGEAGSTTGNVKGVVGFSHSTNAGVAIAGVSFGNRHAGWFETGDFVSTMVTNNASSYAALQVQNAGGGMAAQFWGNVDVYGNLSKSGGGFRIDHPLDPANRYLNHSFVESPERMNVYSGNALLDENGEAIVTLPAYFEALNRDVHYQLTPIGAPAPGLYIAEEVASNRFKIAGGVPGLKVSWQVTGVRHDAWAEANPVQVEEPKAEAERGYYRHPTLFRQPVSLGLDQLAIDQAMSMLGAGGRQVPPVE